MGKRVVVMQRTAFAVAVGAVLWLSGCQTATVPVAGGATPVRAGAFAVAGPRGYCPDRGAGQQVGDTAVVLMGRCLAARKVPPAVLTVSVGPAGSAGAMTAGGDALTGYFTAPEGRAALSRSGRAADLVVVEAVGVGDAYFLHLNDRAAGAYWRAVVGLRGRLITVSANGTDGAPLTPEVGRGLVEATLAALRRANPGARP